MAREALTTRLGRWFGAAMGAAPTERLGAIPGEVAVADTRYLRAFGQNAFLQNPDDLVQKLGLKVYDRMRRDDQVKAALSLKKAAVLGPGWSLEAAQGDTRSEQVKDAMLEQIEALDGAFEDVLWGIMTALDYGFSLTEKIWDLEATGGPRLIALKTRAPHQFAFTLDPYGNVVELTQLGTGSKQEPLPIDKFIHFVVGAEFGNPYGEADLRAAYRPFFLKENWLQWWANFGEMFATPPIKGKTGTSTDTTAITAFLEKLRRMQPRTAIAMPADWDVSLLETTRDPKNFFEGAINRFDLMIARAVLVPEKIGLGGGGAVGGGSYALSQTQLGAFYFILDHLKTRLEACVQDQLIMPWAAFLDGGAQAPEFKMLPPSEDSRQDIAKAWIAAVAGNVVDNRLGDENRMRELLDFQTRDGDPEGPGGKEPPPMPAGMPVPGAPRQPGQPPAKAPLPPSDVRKMAEQIMQLASIDREALPAHLRSEYDELAGQWLAH